MNSKSLRKRSSLIGLNKYIADQQRVAKEIASNPAIVGLMGERDGIRGQYSMALPNGGLGAAKSLTNAGIPSGATIPSVLVSGNGNHIDARPYK